MNESNLWIDIISKFYTKLHETDRVLKASSLSDNRRERLFKYFERLEELHKKVANSESKTGEKLLKSFYYDLYVIKPENVPESYFQKQVSIARERGYGNIELTQENRKQMIDQIIEDQKESLDKWIEYFLYDEESKSYEMWEKYWVFQGIQSLGKYDKEKGKFSKRDKNTVYPFPPVEREYVFTTLKLMEDYIKGKDTEDEIKSALGSGNFKLLYEYVIRQSLLKGDHQSNTTQGKWVKYEQGSDYNILRNSLQGYYTGWCTAAGENFAKSQLSNGDFYVYYTLDENGKAKVPRIAIRMDGKDKIGEIRGIADKQNMEPEMLPILEEKLKEFPDREGYLKKEHDMKLLTLIDKKVNSDKELTIDELAFLYEIEEEIEGFGYRRDPRIEEIIGKRNAIQDLNKLFASDKEFEQIILPDLKNFDGLKLSQNFNRNLNLSRLTCAEGLELPRSVDGDLNLCSLISAKGLELPQSIGGSLVLSSLTSTEGLELPQSVGGDLDLYWLESTKGLKFPQTIGGSLNLGRLTSAEGLELPQSIGGSLDLYSLTSAKGLVLPQSIGENLSLDSLTNAKGVKLPQSIGGTLWLNNLTSAEGLELPQSIGGSLYLSGLTSAKGLELPQSIGRDLFLDSLASAEGLVLPQSFGGRLVLPGLTSAEGLKLPQSIGENLYLNELKSVKGLELPQSIGGDLILSSLTSAEGLLLPQSIDGTLWLNNLTSAEGLKLPYDFDLNKLRCSQEIKDAIIKNPDLYYMKPPVDENGNHIRK